MLSQLNPYFEKSFPYANKKEEKKQLCKLSQEVAAIWGEFLKPETHSKSNIEKLYKNGFYVDRNDKEGPFPDSKRIETFQEKLAEKIRLNYRKKCNPDVRMTSDYGPEGMLREALREADLTITEFSSLSQLFPCKGSVWIRSTVDKSSSKEAISYILNFRVRGF